MKKTILFILILGTTVSLSAQSAEIPYVCPPCNSQCDEAVYSAPGACEHCGMEFVLQTESMKQQASRKTIAFYLQPGVEVLDFAGPMEVFTYAGYKVFTVSETKEPILSQGVLRVLPDYALNDAPPADIVAFFGGNSQQGFASAAITDWIKEQKEVEHFFSVCTGAFALAKAGVLDGLHATTFHSALDALEQNYPKVEVERNARYVDNGKVVTTAGISAGIDGALHLVAKLQGFNKAWEVAYYMEYDKWVPGEGLMLTDQNPYLVLEQLKDLNAYLGSFERSEKQTLEIKVNQRLSSLEAWIGEASFPLFYESKDTFTNVQGEKVLFQRDDQGRVIGYRLKAADQPLLKKL